MKLLRVTAEGLPLFKEKLDISFYTQQRIYEDDKESLYPLFSNIYMNCAEAFIGINASGKTSVLKVILLALNLLNNEPINHLETKDILGSTQKAVINAYFHSDTKAIYRLETEITSERTKTGEQHYKIIHETLWMKPESGVGTRKGLADFNGYEPITMRSREEEFLSDDVSIIIAHNKKQKKHMDIVSLLSYTNANVL
ncbi:MAG: ATP-binding protein, partial [Lachnospiraceae bacterium]|nr:ATP-binding protein [Lachnospiraceae bacterium]